MLVLLPCRPLLLQRNLSKHCNSGKVASKLLVAAVAATCMSPLSSAAAFVVSTGSPTVSSSSPSPQSPRLEVARRIDDDGHDAPQASLESDVAALSLSLESAQNTDEEKNGITSPPPHSTVQAIPASFLSVTPQSPPATISNPQNEKATARSPIHSSYGRVVYGSDDALFGCIERQQLSRNAPCSQRFGSVLDAGTGLHSVRWLASIHQNPDLYGMTDLVGVTADVNMQRSVQREADALGLGDVSTIVVGNWFDATHPLTFSPESFDTILADYLIGAMDGFSPYRQDQMIPKLCQFLKPGGSLFVVGMEPIPDSVMPSTNPANLICRVRQVRDACILLAGHRCYREYPVDWMTRHMTESCGDTLEQVEAFRLPILYRYETIRKQIDVGRSKLPLMPPALRQGMQRTLDELEEQCRQACTSGAGGGGGGDANTQPKRISLGFDYVVSAIKRHK